MSKRLKDRHPLNYKLAVSSTTASSVHGPRPAPGSWALGVVGYDGKWEDGERDVSCVMVMVRGGPGGRNGGRLKTSVTGVWGPKPKIRCRASACRQLAAGSQPRGEGSRSGMAKVCLGYLMDNTLFVCVMTTMVEIH
ncbi:hypothetical protein THAOC_09842 [Thalassiosira oceanica]|uniref:Uncharacterized protein n=1 Tax=Thalassiosira oceanica TaxID=159749 RepID=K0SRL7_THAOC|nr:hypothetical protein THAOC_09842 [Thalassiosira oceanica]|eukprot:EJK68943.1 hypothetical protein THAOC_09842 [Thalassiosira oceanica]